MNSRCGSTCAMSIGPGKGAAVSTPPFFFWRCFPWAPGVRRCGAACGGNAKSTTETQRHREIRDFYSASASRETRNQKQETLRRLFHVIVIHVAPGPALAGQRRAYQRMPSLIEVRPGVLVLRRIAAAHVAAGKAQPQFHPGVAGLDAIFTLALTGAGDFDLIEMVALAGHKILLRLAR